MSSGDYRPPSASDLSNFKSCPLVRLRARSRAHHVKCIFASAQDALTSRRVDNRILNLLERATVLGEEDFTALVNEHKEMNAGLTGNAASELASVLEEMGAAMRLHVRRIFDTYGQNLSKTAEALKVARTTVRRYL